VTSAPAPESTTTGSKQTDGTTTRISRARLAIIADDEDTGRVLLSESVAALGLMSLPFDNGAAALEAALAHEVTLILLDVDMPGMDGFEVCRRLRTEPRFATIPIVMVTGHEDSTAISRAFDAGATDFVSKPVNWALLPRRLEYILRNASASRALQERMSQVNTLVDALPDTLWVVDQHGAVRWSPQAATTAKDVGMDLPTEALDAALDAIRMTAADGTPRTLNYRALRVRGTPITYEMRFNRREGGDVVVVRRDTSERTAAAARIERLAFYDSLTGLPNRQRCIDTAEQMFAEARESRESVAVVSIDYNSLKRVNDSFGHSIGDAVLCAFASRLVSTAVSFGIDPQRITLSRLGGDEFIIVVRHATARELALTIADACVAAFRQPIAHDSLEFYSSPNVGFAVFPEDGDDVATVFKHADTAMYQAKANANNAVAAYTPAMSSRLRDWLDLEGRLRRAVHNDLLSLVYQPKFRVSDHALVGVEALLRWRDAEYGDISPNRFVEIAEDSGLILDMSSWVVKAVCRQLRKWLDRGISIPVAINCSAKELLFGDPARVVEAEAAAAGIPTSLIEIELTESLLLKDSSQVQAQLAKLRSLGCRIALDDFGTGYSSLAYITRFPPDRIKIDKAFVRDLDRSESDAAIANAILSLAQSLDLTVTAEGVERSEQLEWLRARGCHEVQGFLLARPMTAADFEARFLAPARPNPELTGKNG
jgi:diguanylate cyclase (GGDEF)-like protein